MTPMPTPEGARVVIESPPPLDAATVKRAERVLVKAKTLALSKSSFLAVIMLSTPTVWTTALPTAGTDGEKLYVNPQFLLKIFDGEGIEACIGLVLHEALHPAFDHCSTSRKGNRDHKKWNIAGDHLINNALTDMGIVLPRGGLCNPKYNGDKWSTESIYADLPDDGGGSGTGDDIGGTGSDVIIVNDPTRAQDVQQKVRDRIAQAQAVSKANEEYGNLPGSLRRMVDELLNPKMDWRSLLRRFVSERARDDYSWTKPNRRFLPYNMILPSMYSETVGHIVICIDTSGSIDDEIFREFMREVQGIREDVRPAKTTLMCCDTRVGGVKEFAPDESIASYEPVGGGGTDFAPPFEYCEEHNIEPVCFIYFTDMLGSFPSDPGYPVLWAATTDHVGPFGETIHIDINA